MPRVSLFLVLELATLVGSSLTAFKLYKTGLSRRYRVFFIYFLYRIPYAICVLALDHASNIYEYFWVLTNPVTWTFYILVVRELFGLVLARYRGLATLGRWFMYLGTVVSLSISVLTLLPRLTLMPAQSKLLGYNFAAQRGVTLSLVLFLLLMVLFLSRYPIRLPRNVVIHVFLYTIYFLSNSLTALLRGLWGIKAYASVDTALAGIASVCTLAWFWLLTPKGEEASANAPRLDSGHEKRLLSQLDTLNQTLLKSRMK